MIVSYSLSTPDQIAKIVSNSSFTVSIEIDMQSLPSTAFQDTFVFEYSNSIKATTVPLSVAGEAFFKLIIYKCSESNCLKCDQYDQSSQKGICSELDVDEQEVKDQKNNENLAQASSTAVTAISIVSSIAIGASQVASLTSLGPSFFILMQAQDIY